MPRSVLGRIVDSLHGRRTGSQPLRRTRLSVADLEDRVTPDGTLVVTSFYDGAVYKFNAATGDLRETFAAPNATGVLGPAGITRGPDGAYYISAQFAETIFRYDDTTNTLTEFIGPGVLTPIRTAAGAPTFSPSGLKFGPDNSLYVSLNGGQSSATGRVVKFNTIGVAGGPLSYAGTNTVFGNNLVQPSGMTFGVGADAGTLYVSHAGPGPVQRFPNAPAAPAGTNGTSFLAPPSGGNYSLNFPSGLLWDEGDLLVVDLGATSNMSQVLQFNADGSFDSLVTNQNLAFQFSSDIVRDDQDHYLVANIGPAFPPNLQGSVFQYNLDGTFSQPLVIPGDFPNTGPGTSGVAPSSMVFLPNQGPTLALPSGDPTFLEDGPPVFVDSGATVVDDDSPDLNGGLLTITLTANGQAEDLLTFANQGNGPGQIGVDGSNVSYEGNIIGSFSGGIGLSPIFVNMGGPFATPAATQALVRALRFENTSDNPTTAPRTVSITLTDGDDGTSNTVTKNISLIASNDPPAVTTNTGITLDEGATGAITQSNLEATDPDNGAAQLTYTLTAAPANGDLLLNNAVVPVNGFFTQADIDAGLLAYAHDGGETTSDLFTFNVSDGFAPPVPGSFAITVTPVNDPPEVTTNTGATVNEGASVVITNAMLAATDAEGDTPLTFTVVSAPVLGTVRVNGVVATTFTQADIDAGVVTYLHNGEEYFTDSFVLNVSDGQDTSLEASFPLFVVPVNDAPTLAFNNGLAVVSDGTAVIGTDDLLYTDPDNTSSELVYSLFSPPTQGTVLRNGAPTLMFTQADIDAGRVSYVNTSPAATSDSFLFTLSDGGLPSTPLAFNIDILTAPAVTLQPTLGPVFVGSEVTLTAAASGNPTPTVQWQVMVPSGTFTDIPGATSTSYTFTVTPDLDGNQYRAVFTNDAGSTPSNAATLDIDPGLTIVASPVSQTVAYGSPFSLTAEGTGSTKTTLQWQVSYDGGTTFSNIPKATKPTFKVKASTALMDGALYRAVFTNAAGSAATKAASIDVDFTVTLGKKRTVTVEPGTAVRLVAQAKKGTPTGFQWQVSTDGGKTYTNAPGLSTEAAYAIANPQAGDSGNKYRAVVTTSAGTSNTAPATLVVLDAPTAPTTPQDATVAVGATANFTTSAPPAGSTLTWQVSSDGGLTYTDVKGKKTTLAVKKVNPAQNGNLYRAVFTNAVGQTVSGTATLNVT